MSPARLALVVVAVVGLINATFIGVVVHELSGQSLLAGLVAALLVLVAEAVVVKVMGALSPATLSCPSTSSMFSDTACTAVDLKLAVGYLSILSKPEVALSVHA